MIDLVPLIDELSNVKAFFSDLKFVEDTHSYFVDGKRLKYSVSGLIKKFVPYTDWDGVAERVAERTKIEKETLVFKVKTGKDGKVFGSISSKQIWTELDKLGYKIDKKKIMIPDSLTSIGTFYVYVELYKNVTAKIKVELKK